MIKKINWGKFFSKRVRNSILYSLSFLGIISTFFTLFGISTRNLVGENVWINVFTVLIIYVIIFLVVYIFIGIRYKDSVSICINNTPIKISYGENIFEIAALSVIGCDTHFTTVVDDIVISKKSLQGQLILQHGEKNEIDAVVSKEAEKRNLKKNNKGYYDFPMGTIIPYKSSVDDKTYLLLAMTELNDQNESHTDMARFESMLLKMWGEINRVYASNDVALPLLGSGITRFDSAPNDSKNLLKYMLYTLNSSGKSFNSELIIVLYGNKKDIPLYEYKNLFNSF